VKKKGLIRRDTKGNGAGSLVLNPLANKLMRVIVHVFLAAGQYPAHDV